VHVAVVPLQRVQFLAGFGVPDSYGIGLIVAGQALAVGTESHAINPGLTLKSRKFAASLCVPKLQFAGRFLALGVVSASGCGELFAVRAERDAVDGILA